MRLAFLVTLSSCVLACGGDPIATGCSTYESECDGACIPTSADPANCGGCGIACAAGQACSGGVCASTCGLDLIACEGTCADLASDDLHCGSCGTACGEGLGCVDGDCVERIELGDRGDACEGGGPAIEIELDGDLVCAQRLASTRFDRALCACGDVSLTNPIAADAYDSAEGPYELGLGATEVAMNGAFTSTSGVEIEGSLIAAGEGGVTLSNPVRVSDALRSGGALTVNNASVSVEGEAFVDGDVLTLDSATVAIAGALHQPEDAVREGDVQYGSLVAAPVDILPPCACDAPPPIGALVASAETDNENAAVALDPDALIAPGGPRRLDLPCGRYYLRAIDTTDPLAIVAHGRVAIFVGGDVRSSSKVTLRAAAGGELDVFVAGTLEATNDLWIGSVSEPASTRVYVGGDAPVHITNATRVAGYLYTASTLRADNELDVLGGLFVGALESTGELRLHFDERVAAAGDACTP